MDLYHLSILVHIIGIALAAGTTVIAFQVNRRFWKAYGTDNPRAATIVELGNGISRFTGMGLGFLILSGITIMVLVRGVYGQQLWFKIKMVLVLLVIANNIVLRVFNRKTKGMITSVASPGSLQQKITVAYWLQLALYLTIMVLGVFKFN